MGETTNSVTKRVMTQKGLGRQKNPPKEILPRVKRIISNVYGRKKQIKKTKTFLNYKFKSLLNFGMGVSSAIIG